MQEFWPPLPGVPALELAIECERGRFVERRVRCAGEGAGVKRRPVSDVLMEFMSLRDRPSEGRFAEPWLFGEEISEIFKSAVDGDSPEAWKFFESKPCDGDCGELVALSRRYLERLRDYRCPRPDSVSSSVRLDAAGPSTSRAIAAWGRRPGLASVVVGAKGGANAVDFRGWSALYWAAAHADLELVRALLDQGADIEFRGPLDEFGVRGRTPLMVAVESWREGGIGDAKQRRAVAQLLIERGANVNASAYQSSPLIFSIVALGVDVRAKRDPERELETLRMLLKAGARVDGRALIASEHSDRLLALKLLLESGAPADDPSAGGLTALMEAAKEHNTDAIKLLLAHGADPRRKDEGGRTAIDWAKRQDADEIVDLLQSARR